MAVEQELVMGFTEMLDLMLAQVTLVLQLKC